VPAHRKSIQELKLNGSIKANPARYKDRTQAPVCNGELGEPPAAMSKAAKNVWAELAAQAPAGLLTLADRMAVELACTLVCRMRNRRAVITKAEQQLLLQTLSKLGLTPVDRERVTVKPPEKPKEPSPWDEL